MEEQEILSNPPFVWAQVDLNARSRDGYVPARVSRASGPLIPGDRHVLIYEPDDRVAAPARVVRVDADRGVAYLEVNWEEMDDDVAYGWIVSPSLTYVSPLESNAASEASIRLGFVERLRARKFLNTPSREASSRATPVLVQLVAS
jgi:hypothetical protein